MWVVPGGRRWTPTFAIAFFAAPAGVGAWVVPGGRGWTPNFTAFGLSSVVTANFVNVTLAVSIDRTNRQNKRPDGDSKRPKT